MQCRADASLIFFGRQFVAVMRLLHTSRPRSMFVHVHSRDGAEEKRGLANLIWEQPDWERTVMLSTQHQASQWLFCYESSLRRVKKCLLLKIHAVQKAQQTQNALSYHVSAHEELSLENKRNTLTTHRRMRMPELMLRSFGRSLLQTLLSLPFTKERQKK